MSGKKLFSIVIPTYNRGTLLKRCLSELSSALEGLEADVQVVILNNASGDETRKIMDDFKASSPRSLDVTVVHNSENIGVTRNILSSLSHTHGTYWVFLGDDDQIYRDALIKIRALVLEGITPPLFMQTRWPSYGFIGAPSGPMSIEDATELFFFSGNAWGCIARTSLLRSALDSTSRDWLDKNVWAQTYLYFKIISNSSGPAPYGIDFEIGSMLDKKWKVSPSKQYMVRVISDFLKMAKQVDRIFSHPRGTMLQTEITRKILDTQLKMLLDISMRDNDTESTAPVLWHAWRSGLKLSLSKSFLVALASFPWSLQGIFIVYRFMKAGPASVRSLRDDLKLSRLNYARALEGAAETGTRVRDFF